MQEVERRTLAEVARVALEEVARVALDRAKGNQQVAARMLLATVMTNAALLAELLGLGREQVAERVAEYLRERASQPLSDGHGRFDRPSPASSIPDGASHVTLASHCWCDRSAPESSMRKGGESLRKGDSHSALDLPARSAPATKISAAGARAFAMSDAFLSTHITERMVMGKSTRRDWRNARKNSAIVNAVSVQMEKLPWSDDDAPLAEQSPEVVARAHEIWNSRFALLPAGVIDNV